jgi:hypothetical protein
MNLDLTDEETEALLKALNTLIDGDRFQFSARVRVLKAIRAKIRPERQREPLPHRQNNMPRRRRRRLKDGAEGARVGTASVNAPRSCLGLATLRRIGDPADSGFEGSPDRDRASSATRW